MSDALIVRFFQVFQRRFDGSENFTRKYAEYENGFGSATSEYWLGMIHYYKR